jgi:hypothetical protein
MSPIDPDLKLSPPWAATEQWRAANSALARAVDRHKTKLGPAEEIALTLQGCLVSLFDRLDDLCEATCPHCPDPCCLSARIWVDFKDLLFLHLAGQAIPAAQLISGRCTPCNGIGHKGCTLPRLSRPWVCTWYLCPAQTLRLHRRPGSDQAFFSETVIAIKTLRNKMEDAFIRAVA